VESAGEASGRFRHKTSRLRCVWIRSVFAPPSQRVTKCHIGWLRVHVERSMQAVLRYNLGMPNSWCVGERRGGAVEYCAGASISAAYTSGGWNGAISRAEASVLLMQATIRIREIYTL
jgi:hypothetical protein